jgi:deazaflavin-dependent oxidoreductase (nitroreductase family)
VGARDALAGQRPQPDPKCKPSPTGPGRKPLAVSVSAREAEPVRSIEVIAMPYRDAATYRPPRPWVARVNRAAGRLAAFGLSPRNTVSVEVPGRKTGRPRRTALVLAQYDGDRYLVSLAGEAEWVRNVRANGYRTVLRRWRNVSLEEIPVAKRPLVLRAYLSKRAYSKSPEFEARGFFGVSPDASLDELAAIAERYPVFRVVDLS